MAKPTVGVVGLGKMGGNMARCLLDAGFQVTGFDLSEAALDSFIEYGGESADSAAGLAGSVDVLITSLPNPDAIEAAFLGDDGIVAGAREGLVIIEMSTSLPETTRKVAASAAEQGVHVVDGPVEGGPEQCRDGTLVILAGGDPEVIESDNAQAILDALSSEVHHVGEQGLGHQMKLLTNTLSMGNLLLSMEVLALGAGCGIDPDVLYEILPNSSGTSFQFQKRLPLVLNRNFEPGFTVDLAKKDLNLAMETAESNDIPMFMGNLAQQLYIRASAEGHGDEDMASVVKMYEDMTGVPVEMEDEADERFEWVG